MVLPEHIAGLVQPLFDALPPGRAMSQLVVTEGATPDQVALVKSIIAETAIAERPALCAGLWLYVDELDRSHTISQGIETKTGSFWHGIMHRREGDFSNSHYWFNRLGHHPAMEAIEAYDAHAFIDEVERAHPKTPADLIERQRREWTALFEWCTAHA